MFQRTPIWITPRLEGPFTPAEQRRFARVPFAARLHRWKIWWTYERADFDASSDQTQQQTALAALVPRTQDQRPGAPRQAHARLSRRVQTSTHVARVVSRAHPPERSPGDEPDRRDHRTRRAHRRRRGTLRRHHHLRHRVQGERVSRLDHDSRTQRPDPARRLARRRRGVSRSHGARVSEPVPLVRPEHERRELDHLHARSAGALRGPRAAFHEPPREAVGGGARGGDGALQPPNTSGDGRNRVDGRVHELLPAPRTARS